MKKIASIFTLLACLVLTSCTEDPTEDSPITGSWELVKINGADITDETLKDFYTFYSSGSGSWDFYENGALRSESFTWNSYNNDYVELTYSDGVEGSFYYRFNGRNLEMSESSSFNAYNTYEPR